MIKLWKYKKDSNASGRMKILKRLKVRLGRLMRAAERSMEASGISLSAKDQKVWKKIEDVYNQSVLSSKEKEKYKETNRILYSFSAPEVECIGKGKLHKPYEFGNKVAICVSGMKNFIVGVKSFHGNPYDGHTLKQTMEKAEQITGVEIEKVFVDLGYSGGNVSEKSKVYTPRTKKKLRTSHVKYFKLLQKSFFALLLLTYHMYAALQFLKITFSLA